MNLLPDPGHDGEVLREVGGQDPGDAVRVQVLQLAQLWNQISKICSVLTGSESLKANSESESSGEIEVSSENESSSSSSSESDETSESDKTRKFLLDNVKKRKLTKRGKMAYQHNQKHKRNKTIHTFKVNDYVSVYIDRVDRGHADF